jgi:hypothetical protein
VVGDALSDNVDPSSHSVLTADKDLLKERFTDVTVMDDSFYDFLFQPSDNTYNSAVRMFEKHIHSEI